MNQPERETLPESAGYRGPPWEADLGALAPVVQQTLDYLERSQAVPRVWQRDHTLWKPSPQEVTDRLGWLDVPRRMMDRLALLRSLGPRARQAGFTQAVLLGMGGSSLGPLVLGDVADEDASGVPLVVLDSTVPAQVRSVAQDIEPERTLFLVSSKSGGTVETLSLYRCFWDLVQTRVGEARAGRQFIAVSDAGTPLEEVARQQRFWHLFLNPSNIGGRYSVLSYFGMVPAALAGLDVTSLLDKADQMAQACGASIPLHRNPGALLGAAMASMASRGRDKLTIITSPSIASFALWVEQLVAESTGKEGKGIIPVAGEPLGTPSDYGPDRFFVYLRLDGDANSYPDHFVARLTSSDQPVVRLHLQDISDLGAEFFRWQMATALAGAMLRVNPFDQPDVQGAKERTDQVLGQASIVEDLATPADEGAKLDELLAAAQPGDYLAIMAYIHPTPSTDQRLQKLRRVVRDRYYLATTLGYGPRFLHSTGQLHKGGPATGIFLQLVAGSATDLEIPGQSYSFGTLLRAQALGDFQALHALGRRVTWLNLKDQPELVLEELIVRIEG